VKLKSILRKARDGYVFFDLLIGRGIEIVASIYTVVKYTAFAGIIVGMINEAFANFYFNWWFINIEIHWHIPISSAILFTPPLVIFLIIIGIIDIKLVHILQKHNELSTKLNPYLIKLIEKSGGEKRT
jgi:hypothetical protein